METTVELPAWAEHALNGVSVRKPRPVRLQAGDVLAGELLEIGERKNGREAAFPLLTLRVEYGVIAGEPVEPGDWVNLQCNFLVLRRFVQREQPKPGDKVAVQHRGGNGGARDIVAGRERAAEAAGRPSW